MSQETLPEDYIPLNSADSRPQLPDDYIPIAPGGDSAPESPARSPNTMDYLLPTALSTLLQGSPAQFGKGLNSTNIWGDINRPAQAVRQAILSGAQGNSPVAGLQQGYLNPEQTSQSGIQDALLKTAPQTRSVLANFIGGLPASTVGVMGDMAADMANPANALTSLLVPSAAKSIVGQFSPDQFILKKGSTLIDHLLGHDVEDKYVPEMESIYQDRVNKFTPQVQDLAKGKLGVPQEIIDHISQRTPQVVQAAAQGVGNDAANIQMNLENGLAQKNKAVSDAYDAGWAAVPKNAFIALPKTQAATSNFLADSKVIDNVGNLTEYGKQAIGDDASLNKVYQNYLLMGGDSGAASTATSRANVAPVSQSQWTLLRNNFSRARNSANYEAPITNLLDALHADAGDAGVNIQPARALAAQNFAMQDMAKPYLTASGENKFANFFGLKNMQQKDLENLGNYIGQPLVQQAKDVQAANVLKNKIIPYGASSIDNPSNINLKVQKIASIRPTIAAFAERAQATRALHEVLGKGKDVNSLISSLNNRKFIIGGGATFGAYKLAERTGLLKD